MIYDATYDDAGDGYDWDSERGDGESGYGDADADASAGQPVALRLTHTFWFLADAWADDRAAEGFRFDEIDGSRNVTVTMSPALARDLLDWAATQLDIARMGRCDLRGGDVRAIAAGKQRIAAALSDAAA